MAIRWQHRVLDAAVVLGVRRLGTMTLFDRGSLGFEAAALKHFAFMRQHSFAIAESGITRVRWERGDVSVQVYHARRGYDVGLEVVWRADRFPLSALIAHSDPEAGSAYANLVARSPETVDRFVARLAEKFQAYGRPVLDGDDRFLAGLRDEAAARARAFAVKTHVDQARPRAWAAFQARRYEEAVQWYSEIEAELTDVERAKLELARRRLERRNPQHL